MKKRKATFFQKLDFMEGIGVTIAFVTGALGLVIALSAIDAKGNADFFVRLGIGTITFLVSASYVEEKYKKTRRSKNASNM
ncbi:MAG: hypothetical protein HY773_00115 [Candidatus Terrybacteria bacterium]|nr:hypothetical protein [Candidatus Terrybacteria bacterium]